ncbi:hypothetical protein HII36_01300 [Nonomuraea sp. NN258]|uniref:hypothetical protein n=1 Tax=Nonomuraea antri TaxID=2730852 RepID=UPI0015698A33|nr:hypothetical protein [Nonomuraea antri]NRQ30481.1 hypothetical protein [Nonomuraea antri]
MSNPQQPELRRSGKSAAETKSTQAVPESKSGGSAKRRGHPHGTDKGRKGGGKGGGVPPGQRPPHPG